MMELALPKVQVQVENIKPLQEINTDGAGEEEGQTDIFIFVQQGELWPREEIFMGT